MTEKKTLSILLGLVIYQVNVIGEGEIIQTKKKKTTQSQVLRMKIEERWEQMGSEMDKEDFYTKEMSRIITNY